MSQSVIDGTATETVQAAPAAPAPPRPRATPRRPDLLHGVNRGPIVVVLIFLVVIFELALFQLLPTTWGIVANVVLALIVLAGWARRRARTRQASRVARGGRGGPQRSRVGPAGSTAAGAGTHATGASSPQSHGRSSGLLGRLRGRGAAGRAASGGLSGGSGGGLGSRVRGSIPGFLGGTRGKTGSKAGRGSGKAAGAGARRAGGSPSGSSPGSSSTSSGRKWWNPAGWGFGRGRTNGSKGGSGPGSGSRSGHGSPTRSGETTKSGSAKADGNSRRRWWNPSSWLRSNSGRGSNPASTRPPVGGTKPHDLGTSPRKPGSPSGPRISQGEDMGIFRPHRPKSGTGTGATGGRGTQVSAGAPGGSAGGGGFRRSRFSEMSLARFIQALPEVVDEIGEKRASIESRAAAAAEDQPINQNVAAELYAIAAQMRKLEERAGALKSVANQRHEGDRERWEAPRRGSHGVEQKADNRAARNDT